MIDRWTVLGFVGGLIIGFGCIEIFPDWRLRLPILLALCAAWGGFLVFMKHNS